MYYPPPFCDTFPGQLHCAVSSLLPSMLVHALN